MYLGDSGVIDARAYRAAQRYYDTFGIQLADVRGRSDASFLIKPIMFSADGAAGKQVDRGPPDHFILPDRLKFITPPQDHLMVTDAEYQTRTPTMVQGVDPSVFGQFAVPHLVAQSIPPAIAAPTIVDPPALPARNDAVSPGSRAGMQLAGIDWAAMQQVGSPGMYLWANTNSIFQQQQQQQQQTPQPISYTNPDVSRGYVSSPDNVPLPGPSQPIGPKTTLPVFNTGHTAAAPAQTSNGKLILALLSSLMFLK